MKLTLLDGAGNRFAVLDAFRDEVPADVQSLAPRICADLAPRLDGLLIAAPPQHGGDCAMILFNADGSRAETCGNGLRCVAKLVVERGHVQRDEFVIETDAGACATRVRRAGGLAHGRVVDASVDMGRPKILEADAEIALDGLERVHATLVDVGNPHCVLFVADVERAPVTTLGPRLEKHARFPRGTNVEFLELEPVRQFGRNHARLRVWERGVGETQACGSGACAAAAAAIERGLTRLPLVLMLPGGVLQVDAASDGSGRFILSGRVKTLGECDWPNAAQGSSSA
jgi:diaminopimelate epimerase